MALATLVLVLFTLYMVLAVLQVTLDMVLYMVLVTHRMVPVYLDQSLLQTLADQE